VGEGELHAELIKQFGKEKLVGLDFEDYCMIRYNKYQITSPDVVHNLNIFPYPFSNNQFDYVVAGEIIEHLENPKAFLDEVYRILKKDGYLILTTPNGCGVHELLENRKKSDVTTKYGHTFYFNDISLCRLLNYTGFDLQKVKYCFYRKYTLLWVIYPKFGGSNLMVLAKKINK
jgi:ubiquinone/menaquinone biosynthesis C-methylase UbiE